jgi:asparagine synthase (glutamine-hydrolysing)
MDEPSSDITMFPLYFLAKESRKKVTVVNTGEGADELFAGYQHYLVGSHRFNMIPRAVKNKVYDWYYSPFKSGQRKLVINKSFKEDKYLTNCLTQNKDTLNNILQFDIKNELPNWQLARVDRMTMACAQEARVPFLDHKIVEFSANLPIDLKIKNMTGKYIVKQAVKDLLPKEVIMRYKQGFTTPMHEWIGADLLPIAQDELSKESLRESPINPEYTRKLFEDYKRSSKQRPFARTSYQILMLLLLEKWRKRFDIEC